MPAHRPPDCVIRRLNCTMSRHSPPPCVCGIDTDTSVCVHTPQQSCSECLQSNYQKINLWTRAHPLLETIARELPPLLQLAAPCFIQDLCKRQRQTHREAGRGSYILMMLYGRRTHDHCKSLFPALGPHRRHTPNHIRPRRDELFNQLVHRVRAVHR